MSWIRPLDQGSNSQTRALRGRMPAAVLRTAVPPAALRRFACRRASLRVAPRRFFFPMAMAAHQPPGDDGVLRRDVVVVGGGMAAGYMARAFAAAGEGRRLLILSADAQLPYERPALSKKYLHSHQPARLPAFLTCAGSGGPLQDAAWYDNNGIELRRGDAGTVTVADVAARRLATRDGGVVEYATALVVATGCSAARLPAAIGGALRGVHYLRSEADFAAMLAELDALPQPPRVAVVGGGYIGLEVSAGLASRGALVTMIVPEDRVMACVPALCVSQLVARLVLTQAPVYCAAAGACSRPTWQRITSGYTPSAAWTSAPARA